MIVFFKVTVRTWQGFNKAALRAAMEEQPHVSAVLVAHCRGGAAVHGRRALDAGLAHGAGAMISDVETAIAACDGPVAEAIRRAEVWV